jgi:hypothetical protein
MTPIKERKQNKKLRIFLEQKKYVVMEIGSGI